jgi:predicted PurR-regulated permease PerM
VHLRLVLAAVLRPPVDFLAACALPGLLVDASLLLFFWAALFFCGLGVAGVAISMYGDGTEKKNNILLQLLTRSTRCRC